LRVAGWIPGVKWSNQGNQATSGSAGASGSVTSMVMSDFSSEKRLFTLGSSVSNHNTLPQQSISFSGRSEGDIILFDWEPGRGVVVNFFVIEGAAEGVHFMPIARISGGSGNSRFSYRYTNNYLNKFFRIKVHLQDGTVFFSQVIYIERNKPALFIASVSLIGTELKILVHALRKELVMVEIHDRTGRLLVTVKEAVINGENSLQTKIPWLPNGIYFVSIYSKESKQVIKFIKK
jgi:hypothetical protein